MTICNTSAPHRLCSRPTQCWLRFREQSAHTPTSRDQLSGGLSLRLLRRLVAFSHKCVRCLSIRELIRLLRSFCLCAILKMVMKSFSQVETGTTFEIWVKFGKGSQPNSLVWNESRLNWSKFVFLCLFDCWRLWEKLWLLKHKPASPDLPWKRFYNVASWVWWSCLVLMDFTTPAPPLSTHSHKVSPTCPVSQSEENLNSQKWEAGCQRCDTFLVMLGRYWNMIRSMEETVFPMDKASTVQVPSLPTRVARWVWLPTGGRSDPPHHPQDPPTWWETSISTAWYLRCVVHKYSWTSPSTDG